MKKTNLNQLAYTGTGELFLNYYALQLHGKNNVETWIAQANKLGIRVHIWQQVFYNNNTGWINPVKNGKINNNIIEEKITESLQYAKIKGISGIHFDYLRYNNNAYQTSKSTEAINTFTQKATQAIHNIDTRLIVSSTIIPEKENSQYYYAQDYNTLSKYLDVIIPLLYKGNYGKDTTWIQDNIKYYTENTQHAQIWAGLQGYQSDYNLKKLSTTEITQDTQKTINTQAKGAIIYRIGLTNTINFNNIITNTNNNTNTSDSANSTNNNTNIKKTPEHNKGRNQLEIFVL